MKLTIIILTSYFGLCIQLKGQMKKDALFTTETPLKIGLKFNIQTVAKTKSDSVYLPHWLHYQKNNGAFDSIKMALKSRGNFRLEHCYFPPLWVKFNKKDTKGTAFAGHKKLKLVLPCYNRSGSNELIVREYLCYKLYEVISPYYFKSRLVDIDFTEIISKKQKKFQLKGILIEDLEKTAERYNAKPREDIKIRTAQMQDTASLRFAFFQYMIANTDLSSTYQHNTKLVQLNSTNFISMPYDFDMSGMVNAPYAVVSQVGSEVLPVQNVRERLYRGWCRSAAVTEFVRNDFISKKSSFFSVVDQLKSYLTEKEINSIKSYLEEFFEIISNDKNYRNNIIDQCREN